MQHEGDRDPQSISTADSQKNDHRSPSRRSFLHGLGVASATVATAGSALASKPATPATDVDIRRNLTYADRPEVGHGSHVPGELRLDLYLPQQRSPHPTPVIVYIHGGMWMFGAKDSGEYIFEHLARSGFAVASIEYRFIQEAIFPAQIHDVNAAVRWLRAHADEYNLDPKHVATFGASAGGHLAALAGVTNEVDEFEGDGPHSGHASDVQAAVSWFGLFALHKMVETAPPESEFPYEEPGSPESQLVGETIAENPEAGQYASPITYLDSDDPPLLLYHGEDDGLVGYGQSELMYDKAREVCHDTTFTLLESIGHSSDDVFSALSGRPPADATVRTIHCRPAGRAPEERTKEGPVASLTDMERFLRRNLQG